MVEGNPMLHCLFLLYSPAALLLNYLLCKKNNVLLHTGYFSCWGVSLSSQRGGKRSFMRWLWPSSSYLSCSTANEKGYCRDWKTNFSLSVVWVYHFHLVHIIRYYGLRISYSCLNSRNQQALNIKFFSHVWNMIFGLNLVLYRPFVCWLKGYSLNMSEIENIILVFKQWKHWTFNFFQYVKHDFWSSTTVVKILCCMDHLYTD